MRSVHDARAAARTGSIGIDPEPLLERSEQLGVLTSELNAVVASGRGRMVLIAGEAGIGKSAVVDVFCRGLDIDVLHGACEALFTPRPLGPLVDIGDQLGGELAAMVEAGVTPSDLVAALAGELRRGAATVVVLEDLHWADDATLDVVRLLGRRCDAFPALVIATYRDDELERTHPLRIVLGELPRSNVTRLRLAPLSPEAVAGLAGLAGPDGIDPVALHERTAGNPFYVSEVLAAGDTAMPDSVRDAVLARAARLSDRARALLDAVAIVPQRAELWLLEALAPDELSELESCIDAGMLRASGDAVAFRHEIARGAVEGVLPPNRAVALHRRALAALIVPPHGKPQPARIAHHAEVAGDAEAVLRYAELAGEQAAALGAHREAAAQFARALRYGDGLAGERRAELLERRSYECYLIDAIGDAIAARQAALSEHRDRGDRLREGDAHRWLSRLEWFAGDNATAEAHASAAVSLLETLPPGRELAMAYSNMAQLRTLAYNLPQAQSWGLRAIELAEQLDETEILVHALNNVGTAELGAGDGGRYGEAGAKPDAGGGRGPRGARGASAHKPCVLCHRGARLRGRKEPSSGRDRLLPRARSRLMAALHDRMAGKARARAGSMGRRRRGRDDSADASGRGRADPHHPVGGARAPPSTTRRPRPVDAARRGIDARLGHRRAAAPAARGARPSRGPLARRPSAPDRGSRPPACLI